MTLTDTMPPLAAISTNDRATPSLVYRALLRSIRDGLMVPGAKLPNERELAQQLNTSRTAVRSALEMMERQGLVRRRVGSGTFLTDDAHEVFGRMDQTTASPHEDVPSFAEIVEDKYLPKDRAEDCPREYSQVAFAFQELIGPHVDEALAKKVFAREWLPAPANAGAPARFR